MACCTTIASCSAHRPAHQTAASLLATHQHKAAPLVKSLHSPLTVAVHARHTRTVLQLAIADGRLHGSNQPSSMAAASIVRLHDDVFQQWVDRVACQQQHAHYGGCGLWVCG